jgi:hypothetical protein
MLDYFTHNGSITNDGLLSIGWHGEFAGMRQSYSGAGSPYWAAKGFLGLALPAEHRVWTAVEEPLPVEAGDTQRLIAAPGWQVNGTAADGVVRIRNHGTDHALAGAAVADSPLYARLGYSTHTFPDLESESLDNAVVLVDAGGRLTHRTGFEFLGQKDLGGVLAGASRSTTNWITVDPHHGPDHGSGANGAATPGPEVTVVSLARGAVELRLVRVRGTSPAAPATLRIGGWPVDAGSQMVSKVRPLAGFGLPLEDSGRWVRESPHPMGERLTIPWIGASGAADDGDYAAVVVLAGEGSAEAADGVRFVPAPGAEGWGRFEFADGTAIDVAAVWEGLANP